MTTLVAVRCAREQGIVSRGERVCKPDGCPEARFADGARGSARAGEVREDSTRLPGFDDFPTVRWGDVDATFSSESVDVPTESVAAVVVFAIHWDGFVVADIPGRGWCVPSGRPEKGETPLDAAIRETAEETGCTLVNPVPIGAYILTEPGGGVRYVPTFTGRATGFE